MRELHAKGTQHINEALFFLELRGDRRIFVL